MSPIKKAITYTRLLVMSFVVVQQADGQIIQDTGSIFTEVSSIISNMPDDMGDDFALPSPSDLASWGAMLDHLFLGNYSEAADTAALIGYDFIEFVDDTGLDDVLYYILKSNSANYWGTYIYNPNYCRPLDIQSPHPQEDFNTGKQGIYVFKETAALFFCLSGTNRCNQSAHSNCSGTTKACSNNLEMYRISDLAHTLSTVFQSTTDSLFRKFDNSYFLQLHGFTKEETDPFIILSNGTQSTPQLDYIAALASNLAAEDALFIDSIKVAHLDLNWDRLRGFTNVQGRLINSSNDPCSSDAVNTNGRFIHMEQEKTRLRSDQAGWQKVANAVINTFSCSAPLPIDLSNFVVQVTAKQNVRCEWETAAENNNDYFTVERSKDGSSWGIVAKVRSAGYSSSSLTYTTVDEHPYVGISYYRLKQTDFDGQSTYYPSKSVTVLGSQASSLTIYPNPSSGHFTLKGAPEELRCIDIYNGLGQNVTQQVRIMKGSENSISIELNGLSSGLYTIRTKTEANLVVKQ